MRTAAFILGATSFGLVCFLAGGLNQYVRQVPCPGRHLVPVNEDEDVW